MIQISYSELSNEISKHSGLVRILNILDKTITYITYFLYLVFLIYALLIGDKTLWYRSVLIPGISFIVISQYRRYVSAPRPYEVYGFKPAIHKETVGRSFPSRHAFSIFMVAMTYLQVSQGWAIAISVMGLLLMALRVIGGVHFLKDVIAGALLGILCGLAGFGIICGIFGLCVLPF